METNKFESFESFVTLCKLISDETSYLKKTLVLSDFFKSDLNFNGNVFLYMKLLIAKSNDRVYNLNTKQLIKLFSRIFEIEYNKMFNYLNRCDVADTICHFFSLSIKLHPVSISVLTLNEIDSYLDKLTAKRTETDQLQLLNEVASKCTRNDLHMFIRLIKKELRINAGASVLLNAISSYAYDSFQLNNNLKHVISTELNRTKTNMNEIVTTIKVMSAIRPMLARICKSVDDVFIKCQNKIYAEVKYDGERLQIHKNANSFCYFSRNLKLVDSHKTEYLDYYISRAFPYANQLILDGELVLYCKVTKKPLPFGSLGIHKMKSYNKSNICFYAFDCLNMNGEVLINKPLEERRRILIRSMTEIPGYIVFAEQKLVSNLIELDNLIRETIITKRLEGLVLKDTQGVYEVGKRNWIKIKKEYLNEGNMCESVDLVVLGAYYGVGKNCGTPSVFLMGCLNQITNKWCTVTKVSKITNDNDHDIEMINFRKNMRNVPSWLFVNKKHVPDLIVTNPKKAPVWEISGSELTKSNNHTADGISIRFPRFKRFRDDKSWKEATNLKRLKLMFWEQN
jgi:DNA ligase 3